MSSTSQHPVVTDAIALAMTQLRYVEDHDGEGPAIISADADYPVIWPTDEFGVGYHLEIDGNADEDRAALWSLIALAVQHQALLAAAQEHGWTSEQVVAGMELAESAVRWDDAATVTLGLTGGSEDEYYAALNTNVAALARFREVRDA